MTIARRGGPPEVASPADALPDDHVPTTGVIFVHGIGSQKAGETLLQWSAPLIEVLTAWKAWAAPSSAIRDPIRTSRIDFDGNNPRIVLDIPGVTVGGERFDPHRWVLTEAWWAAKVAPPSLSTMTNWLGPRGGIGRIVDAILGNTSREAGLANTFRPFVTPFVAVLAGLVLTIYALIRGISLLIPIDDVRNAAILQTFDNSLTGWFGDVRILLYDPAQSSNIRGNLAAAIRRFHEVDKVDHVIVMAHSGGVMVSYLTLVDPAFTDPNLDRVDKLITFGEGFNLAMVLTSDSTGMFERLRTDVTDDHHRPTMLWRDFWGSHDPAPAGAVLCESLGPLDPVTKKPVGAMRPTNINSRQVWNRRSLLDDHGSYFDNDEEFTLAVLREIDHPTGWGEGPLDQPPPSRFYPTPLPNPVVTEPPADHREARHRERVAILALMRQVAVASAIGTITVVLAHATRLSELGKGLADIIAGIPVIHDVLAVPVQFLESMTIPNASVTVGNATVTLAGVVDTLGLGALQAIVLVSVVQLICAPVRADEAWASSNPRRRWFFGTEVAIALMLGVALAILAFAPGHPELLGAGLIEWSPGILLTLATLAVGYLGTLAARLIPSLSRIYAGVAIGVFLAAMVCAILVMFRRPGLEHGELGYLVIWGAFILLYRLGLDRWNQWDRVERLAAYQESPDVTRSRVPVRISIAGFVTAGFGLVFWIIPGFTPITVLLFVVAVILVGAAIVAGWAQWPTQSPTVAALPAVDSARGKV
jgi:hypothetical protein